MKSKILICILAASLGIKAQNLPNASSVNPAGTAPLYLPGNYIPGITLNYVRSTTPVVPVTTEAQIVTTDPYQSLLHTRYFDGLGRPVQDVDHIATPYNNDMITLTHYDQFGREAYHFMPYARGVNDASEYGKFDLSPFANERSFYKNNTQYTGEDYFYSQTVYENSPLNRITKTMPQGNAWGGNSKGTTLAENALPASAGIRIFTIAYTSGSLPATTATYGTGALWVKKITDEDGNFTEEYSDKNGKVILRTTGKTGNSTKLSTYYVYDDFGKLRFIIPPKAVKYLSSNSWTMTAAIAADLCFRNEYDGRERMIFKQEPAVGQMSMVYNLQDELVLSQTAEQKNSTQWTFYKYDAQSRLVQSGVYTSSSTQATLQNIATGTSTTTDTFLKYLLNISGSVIVRGGTYSNAKIYIENYYDDYSFTGQTYDASFIPRMPAGFDSQQSDQTRGLLTGTAVAIMDDAATVSYLMNVYYYDSRSRLLQTQSQNRKGGWDIITSCYDFTGKKQATFTQVNNTLSNHTLTEQLETYYYDQLGRITEVYHSINGRNPIAIERNSYNEEGKPVQKFFANSETAAEEYEYNIRGWLISINKDFCYNPATVNKQFGMELSYNYGYTTNYLNGNIAGMKWRNAGKNTELRSYGYRYDAYNRLTNADFVLKTGAITDAGSWSNTVKDYTASNMAYDENGNILSMKQMGLNPAGQKIVLDDLTYSYTTNTNKLQAVNEATGSQSKSPTAYDGLGDFRDVAGTTDYTYDGNGNLKTDANKSFSFVYNLFVNKTRSITKGIYKTWYLYDAMGNKLQKKTMNGSTVKSTTDYIQNTVFENDSLKFLNHRQGRMRYTGSRTATYVYDYYLKDHLGNTRTVINYGSNSSTLLTRQRNDSLHEVDYIATSEPVNATKEGQLFSNIESTRAPKTKGKTPEDAYVAKLNPQDSKNILGPDITLKVMAGDSMKISAQAYCLPTQNNTGDLPQAILNNFIAAFSGAMVTPLENGTALSSTQAQGLATQLLNLQKQLADNTRPMVFLNYMLFDEYNNLIPAGSGAIQAKNKDDWQTLETEKIRIPQNGFLRVFTSSTQNSSGRTATTPAEINNTMLAITQGSLVEEYNYYPYGLVFDQTNSVGIKSTNYLYNGKELQHNEFAQNNGIELNDYGARMQDPQIGRWTQVDPLAGKYPGISPYIYCSNNPINAIDPDGRDIIVLNAPSSAGGSGHAAVLIGNDKTGWALYSKNGTSPIPSSGKSNYQPERGVKFDTFSEFQEKYLNSELNFNKNGEAIYTNGFRVSSDDKVDARMKKAAKEQTESWYDVSGTISGSCIDVCKDALEAGGFDPGTDDKSKTGASRALLISKTVKAMVPNEVYKNITKFNKGIDISKQLVPSQEAQDKAKKEAEDNNESNSKK